MRRTDEGTSETGKMAGGGATLELVRAEGVHQTGKLPTYLSRAKLGRYLTYLTYRILMYLNKYIIPPTSVLAFKLQNTAGNRDRSWKSRQAARG